MKRHVWKLVFIFLGCIDVFFVGFPIAGLYLGSAITQANALTLILESGLFISIFNIVVFGLYIFRRHPKGLRLVISVFAVIISVYYLVTVLT